MTENYRGCYEYLSAQFEQVGGYDFYRELFPDNELYGVKYDDFSHPSAVYLYQGEDERLHRRKMYHDTWEKDYTEFVEQNPLTLCSGLVYRRNKNRLEHAQRMNALIFDLDGVGIGELRNLFLRFDACAAVAYAGLPCVVRERSAPVLCVQGADRSIPQYQSPA